MMFELPWQNLYTLKISEDDFSSFSFPSTCIQFFVYVLNKGYISKCTYNESIFKSPRIYENSGRFLLGPIYCKGKIVFLCVEALALLKTCLCKDIAQKCLIRSLIGLYHSDKKAGEGVTFTGMLLL